MKKGECSTRSDRSESRTCGRRVAVKAVQAAGATSFSESSGHRRTLKMCLLGELAWLGWQLGLSLSLGGLCPSPPPPSLRPLSSGIGFPLAHSAHSKPLPRSLPGTEFGAGFLFPGPLRVALGTKAWTSHLFSPPSPTRYCSKNHSRAPITSSLVLLIWAICRIRGYLIFLPLQGRHDRDCPSKKKV